MATKPVGGVGSWPEPHRHLTAEIGPGLGPPAYWFNFLGPLT